jgi:hypothetical protein
MPVSTKHRAGRRIEEFEEFEEFEGLKSLRRFEGGLWIVVIEIRCSGVKTAPGFSLVTV